MSFVRVNMQMLRSVNEKDGQMKERFKMMRFLYWAMLLVLTKASMSTLSELFPFLMLSRSDNSTGAFVESVVVVAIIDWCIWCSEPERAFQLRSLSRSACRLRLASGNAPDKREGVVDAGVLLVGGNLNVGPSRAERSTKASSSDKLWPLAADPALPVCRASGAAGGVSGESCASRR